MSSHCIDVLSRLVPESTVALFAGCGVPVVQAGTKSLPKKVASKPPTVAGVVGFTGDYLRGTLIVATSFQFVDLSRPAELRARKLSPDRASDWIAVRDWSAELANQLLGRIKRRLFVFNVRLEASTPTALSGPMLAMAKPKSKSAVAFVFTHGEHEVAVHFDGEIDPRLDLTQARKDMQESVPEGRVILF